MSFDELLENTRIQIYAQKQPCLYDKRTNALLGRMIEGVPESKVDYLIPSTIADAIMVHISLKYLRYCEIVEETLPDRECEDVLDPAIKHKLYKRLRDNLLQVMKLNGIVEPVQ